LNQFLGLTQSDNAFPYTQQQFPTQIFPFDPYSFFAGNEQTTQDYRDRIERLKKLVKDANEEIAQAEGSNTSTFPQPKKETKSGCPSGYEPVSVFGLFSYCGKKLHSDDSSVGTVTPSGERIPTLSGIFQDLPQGSGIFLIGIVVIILLFLFVRR
jgi:hypothetical protein